MSPPSGNGNGRGPPPWAGKPDHVTDDGESVAVGPDRKEQMREKALSSSDQLDRIEAKLDLLLDAVGVE